MLKTVNLYDIPAAKDHWSQVEVFTDEKIPKGLTLTRQNLFEPGWILKVAKLQQSHPFHAT